MTTSNEPTGALTIDKALWWLLEGEDLAKAVSAIGEQLWEADESRRTEIEKNLRRFGGKSLRGLFPGRDPAPDVDNVRVNITKSVTETLMAKVGSNRPRPKVLTTGANHSLRVRAKKLQRFLDGTYQQAEVYAKTPLVFRDALLTGTGVVHFFANRGKKRAELERVFPPEILVDHYEAVNGNPQTLFRVKYLDKGVLLGMFPKHARAIADLPSIAPSEMPDLSPQLSESTRSTRMVRVFEAFKLAVFADDGEKVCGRRVVAVGDLLLGQDEWEEDYFPFEFFHWSAPVRGFWGDSAVGEIRGMEREVNTLLEKTQKAMQLVGQPWVVVQRGGKMKPPKITNEIALIVEYDGPNAPTVQTHQSVDPQILTQTWALHAKAYEQLGTNQLQASATKPPGIDSGRGLEQLSEEHLVRFKHVAKDFEDIVAKRFARQFVRVARELDEALKARGEEGYVLRATANKTAIEIKWADAFISPDDFFLETWPTSVLPLTPSGKTEEVERWQQNQWITPVRAKQLLEFPDLESEQDIATADAELLDYQLERMLDDGEVVVPEPRQDLQTALQRGTYALEKGLTDGTPETHLDNLRNFLNACEELLTPPAPPPGPAAPGMPAAPNPMGAMPMPAASLGPASPLGLPGVSPPPMPMA